MYWPHGYDPPQWHEQSCLGESSMENVPLSLQVVQVPHWRMPNPEKLGGKAWKLAMWLGLRSFLSLGLRKTRSQQSLKPYRGTHRLPLRHQVHPGKAAETIGNMLFRNWAARMLQKVPQENMPVCLEMLGNPKKCYGWWSFSGLSIVVPELPVVSNSKPAVHYMEPMAPTSTST